ncbi:hypothetical protein HPS12939_1306 [Glaesserella parasuis 12939]|nr:hypothetical protein HPS12939_1306 [Glaesserella parasuis 12939]
MSDFTGAWGIGFFSGSLKKFILPILKTKTPLEHQSKRCL